MRLVVLVALLALAGCKPTDPFPSDPERRKLTLSESVLRDALSLGKDPAHEADAALALAQVSLSAHAPRLRLIVAGDSPVLAWGAARALVRILRAREEDDASALATCAKSESNEYVRGACREAQSQEALRADLQRIASALESKDRVQRREGLRALLSLEDPFAVPHPRVDAALLHLVQAEDADVRLLATAAFLRRSLSVGR